MVGDSGLPDPVAGTDAGCRVLVPLNVALVEAVVLDQQDMGSQEGPTT